MIAANGQPVCSHNPIAVYLCFEHTTYRMEFSRQFGPSWRRLPEWSWVYPDPDGHLSHLWDYFGQWYDSFAGQPGEAAKEDVCSR